MSNPEPEKRRDAEDAESRRVLWRGRRLVAAIRQLIGFSPRSSAFFASLRFSGPVARVSFWLKGLR